MTVEQIKADLEIIGIELRQFNLAMIDRWDDDIYRLDANLRDKERQLIEKYCVTFGVQPKVTECKYHEEIVNLQRELKEQLI